MSVQSRACLVVALASLAPASGPLVARTKGEPSPAKVTLTPDQLKWAPVPSLLPGAMSTVVFGEPSKAGPYAYRVKFPRNFKVQPHSHPESRTYTVLSGTFYQGEGDTFDESKLMARPTGSYYTYVPGKAHFGATRGEEVVLQITSCEGASAIHYVNPSDDPRTPRK